MSLKERFQKVADDPDTPIGPEGETALHLAAQEGDADIARQALDAGAAAHARDRLNNTPLIYAALRGDACVIALLLRRDPSSADVEGNAGTALNVAAAGGAIDAARALLGQGAGIDAPNGDGTTPLMSAVFAKDREMVEFLLRMGASPLAQRENGENALHLAARQGDAEIITLLVAHGGAAGLEQQTKTQQMSPLSIAVLTGEAEAARCLIALGALPNLVDARNMTPLHLAAERGDIRLISLLTEEAHADVNAGVNTPLHVALYENRLAAAKELLRLGADPDIADGQKRLPLQIAAWKGDAPAVDYLLDHVASPDPERAAQDRANALYEAVFYEHGGIARRLIESGKVDVNRPNATGGLPLQAALLQTDAGTVAALLAAGANPDAADKAGRTALGLAVGRKNSFLAGLLLEAGADPDRSAGDAGPPLFEAVANDDKEMVSLLLRHRANPLQKDSLNRTALDVARQKGFSGLVPILLAAETEYVADKKPPPSQQLKPS